MKQNKTKRIILRLNEKDYNYIDFLKHSTHKTTSEIVRTMITQSINNLKAFKNQ